MARQDLARRRLILPRLPRCNSSSDGVADSIVPQTPMHLANPLLLVCACLLSLASCTRDQAAAPAPLRETVPLPLVATVRLWDRDTALVARPNGFAVSVSGDYFVTDVLSRRVLRFNARGDFVQTIGRYGGGPNEFEAPGSLTTVSDSTLVIVDNPRRQALLWHLPGSSVIARLPLTGLTHTIATSNGVLYAATPDLERGTAGVRWRPDQGTVDQVGTVLDVFRERLPAIWGAIKVAAMGDSLLYVGGRSDYVIIADTLWQPRDSVAIPRAARRGIPSEIDYRMGAGRNIYDVMRQLSTPFALHGLSAGRIAVFHLDASIEGNLVFGDVFMTVVSAAGPTRCVDVPVVSREPRAVPRITMMADTLFVLDHYVHGEAAVAEVRKHLVGPDVC
jgi:hypothetical protein